MSEADWSFGHELKARFRLDPAKTGLVVIDMQNVSANRNAGVGKYFSEQGLAHLFEWRFSRIEQIVLPNLKSLLSFFRRHNLKVIYVTVGSDLDDFSDMNEAVRPFQRVAGNRFGEPVNSILDDIRPLPSEKIIRKTTESGFMSSSIHAVLRAYALEYLCFAGVSTNQCVDSTARNAADLNYHCVIVEDCCAGTREDLHKAALASFGAQLGRILTTEEVMRELLQGQMDRDYRGSEKVEKH